SRTCIYTCGCSLICNDFGDVRSPWMFSTREKNHGLLDMPRLLKNTCTHNGLRIPVFVEFRQYACALPRLWQR
ncbi:MAG: hypothetical protein ACPG77_17345, partial [Nannocystaceae bacterium]